MLRRIMMMPPFFFVAFMICMWTNLRSSSGGVDAYHHHPPISVIKPYPPTPKYIQGLEFGNGHLFYGTNDGNLVCLGRTDNSKLLYRWTMPIATRNIRKIQTNQKYILASCDTETVDATGRSVLCDIKSGHVLDSMRWRDTTVFEGITFSHEWIRVNAEGCISSKFVHRDQAFSCRLRLPLGHHDYIVCGTLHCDRLYLMTLSGNLWIVDMEQQQGHGEFKIVDRYKTKFQLATTIHVTRPLRSDNSVFVYVGNQEGEVYFTQITDRQAISETRKKLHSSVITQMESNMKGIFVAFQDSTIVSMEIMSFRETMRVSGDAHFYTNTDSFSLSPRGLFYISDNETRIRMTSLA